MEEGLGVRRKIRKQVTMFTWRVVRRLVYVIRYFFKAAAKRLGATKHASWCTIEG